MESRLKKSLNAGGRNDRASEDASRGSAEDKFISSQERRRMWSEELTQSALPKIPPIDGWHLCWLSTNNSYDSIDKRMRQGYVPVKADEIPGGYEEHRVKSGEHIGYISCNEMLLFKLPMDIYQDWMLYQHHERPREEAEKVKVQMENLQGRDSNGRTLLNVEGEGIGSIEQQPNRNPVFIG
jgi:hypothetical protein